MSPEEQFTQLIRTADQWKSGLAVRLNFVNIGGIELHSFPSFKNWIDELRNKKIGGVAIDECGQIYFVEHKSADLFLYEPGFKQTQRIFYHEFQESGRIILDEKSLYIVQKKEVRVYSRDSFQLKQIVNTKAEKQNRTVIEASDIAVDEQRNLYILDKKSGEILKRIVRDEFPRVFVKSLKEPLSIAVGKDNFLFVLDRQISGFLRFKEGSKPEIIGHFPKEFSPTILAAGLNGIIVAATESGLIHRFDADGSDLGKIEIPNFQGTISHIAIHRDGSIYISTDQGMAILGSQERVSKEEGIYYSRTLDSGIAQCQWHRLAFEADLPAHTLLKVHFYSSDE
ncbi:MAG TPA: hypothetical protein VLH08_09500, partial [Acidobacteriota bacterium]|nr:hypothetical protein [Acidobacteriota bacterium]